MIPHLKIHSLPSVALLTFALAGCAGDPPPVALAPPEIHRSMLRDVTPKSAMVCAAEPGAKDVGTVAAGAAYVADLRAAGADCRRKLRALRTLIEDERE